MCEVTDLFWQSGYAVGEEEGERRGERRGRRQGERRGKRQGKQIGKRIGREQGIYLTRQAQSLFAEGKTKTEIAKALNVTEKEVLLMVE